MAKSCCWKGLSHASAMTQTQACVLIGRMTSSGRGRAKEGEGEGAAGEHGAEATAWREFCAQVPELMFLTAGGTQGKPAPAGSSCTFPTAVDDRCEGGNVAGEARIHTLIGDQHSVGPVQRQCGDTLNIQHIIVPAPGRVNMRRGCTATACSSPTHMSFSSLLS